MVSVFYSSSVSEIKPEISSVYIYPKEDNLISIEVLITALPQEVYK